ncbi:MAG TPA: hypothetical protein VH859_03630 [Candidatus Limnocylindria bacterium]|jgi:hypothetical protein
MNDLAPILLVVAVLLLVGGMLLVRSSGSQLALGRRLAGATGVRVGDLLDRDPLPPRPVRVAGRIRCPDPIVTDDDERLVALHRDVEVRLGDGRWRTIERMRETRGMELWDHDGSLALDLSRAAEPLVTIPYVWRGQVAELEQDGHRAAVERLVAEGLQPGDARAVTRTISTVDRLLVLARPTRAADGATTLEPPPGGFVVSALELPDAMRLLGGRGRRRLLAGFALVGLGGLAGLAGIGVLILAALA